MPASVSSASCALAEAGAARRWLRPYCRRTSVQTDVELVGPVAADQRQFERGAVGAGAGRQAVEFEGKPIDAGRALLDQSGNRQRPVRRRPLDEQADLLGLG